MPVTPTVTSEAPPIGLPPPTLFNPVLYRPPSTTTAPSTVPKVEHVKDEQEDKLQLQGESKVFEFKIIFVTIFNHTS